MSAGDNILVVKENLFLRSNNIGYWLPFFKLQREAIFYSKDIQLILFYTTEYLGQNSRKMLSQIGGENNKSLTKCNNNIWRE